MLKLVCPNERFLYFKHLKNNRLPSDGRTDGRTDLPTDGPTDGRTLPHIEMGGPIKKKGKVIDACTYCDYQAPGIDQYDKSYDSGGEKQIDDILRYLVGEHVLIQKTIMRGGDDRNVAPASLEGVTLTGGGGGRAKELWKGGAEEGEEGKEEDAEEAEEERMGERE